VSGSSQSTEKAHVGPSRSLNGEIQRVLASRTLRRSDQLRKLLFYLGESGKSADATLLSELEIGTRALGRKNFNPKLDTIVRSEMLRLRRKLDEYYADEDPTATERIGFDRNSYSLTLVARDLSEPIPLAPPPETRRSFTSGVAIGAVVTAVVAAIVFTYVLGYRGARAPSSLASHPIWRGFTNTQVDVLIGTPLFFINEHGFERLFDHNLPEDVPDARKRLSIWPALPRWDIWTSYENVGAAVSLSRALSELGDTLAFIPARDESVGTLSGRKTIVLGAPRFAPLLLDVLADENFTVPKDAPRNGFGGFRNSNPKKGEAPVYLTEEATVEQRSDESTPDYALISSKVLSGGGEVLSVFGNRAQTAGFVIRALLEKPLLDQLSANVFASPPSSAARHVSAQAVVRVDYSKGKPTGAVFLTHRIRY
jgi:hypothetical protein